MSHRVRHAAFNMSLVVILVATAVATEVMRAHGHMIVEWNAILTVVMHWAGEVMAAEASAVSIKTIVLGVTAE